MVLKLLDALGLVEQRRRSCASTASVRSSEAAGGSWTFSSAVAVVLLGQEAARQPLCRAGRVSADEEQQDGDADQRLADQAVAQADVAVRRPFEPAVEGVEEAAAAGRASALRGRSSIADSAGDSVSALKAEIITETAIVIANCWFSRPWMPLITPTGMNTAARISAMPMTGPDTSLHRLERRVLRAHALLRCDARPPRRRRWRRRRRDRSPAPGRTATAC